MHCRYKVNIKVTTTDGTFMTTTGTVPSSSGGSGSGTQYNVVVTQTANGAIAPAGTTSYAAGATPSFHDYAGFWLSHCKCND